MNVIRHMACWLHRIETHRQIEPPIQNEELNVLSWSGIFLQAETLQVPTKPTLATSSCWYPIELSRID